MLFLLGVLDEGHRDGSVILDEPSVVTNLPKKALSVFRVLGIGQSLMTEV